MGQVYGYNAKLFVKAASSLDTLPSGNWLKVPFISSDYGKAQALLPDDALSVANQGPEETRDPDLDVKDVRGAVVVPLDLRGIGWWLRTALGAPTTTGSGAPYTHTFKSSAAALALLGLEFQHPGVTKFNKSVAVVDGFELPLARAGWPQMTFNLRGRDETRDGSTGTGTPTTPTVTRFTNRVLTLEKDGSTFAKVLSGNIQFSNAVEEVPGLGAAALMEAYDPGPRTVRGTLEMRFASMTEYDQAEALTPLALEAAWTLDADNSLSFLLPRVFLEPNKPALRNRGGAQAAFNYQAVRDSSEACALKVVLVNDVASYA